jgi:uncharacterized protein YbjT (DUF2867 family)
MTRPTALIAGSSGLTGSLLTDQLLAGNLYERVIVLVRKKSGKEHPLLTEIIFDFDQPQASMVKADHVYCCLGTTIKKAGSRESFYKVDFTYPFELAKMAKDNGTEYFAIVTAMGANARSSIFYNRVKGDIETALKGLSFEKLGIFRPSMLLGDRKENRAGESFGQKVMLWLDFLIPKKYKAIQASRVAEAMIKAGQDSFKGVRIIESDEMY